MEETTHNALPEAEATCQSEPTNSTSPAWSLPIDIPGRQAYLKYLDENSLSEAEVLPIVPEVDADTKAMVSAILLSALQAGKVELVQRYQEATAGNTNLLLSTINKSLVERFRAGGISVPDNVYAGVFPTNSFNAHVVKRPPGYIVLINTGTFEILEAIISVFSALSPGDARIRAKQTAGWLRRYCDDKVLPDPKEVAALQLDFERSQLAVNLTTAVEEFAIAHEYGHLVNGHVGQALSDMATSPNRTIQVATKTKDQELEADLWAVNALTSTKSPTAPPEGEELIVCSGPLLFLSLGSVTEAYFESKGLSFDTHPPAIQRYTEIRYALAKAGRNHATRFAESFRKFCILIGEELGVELPDMEATMLVIDSVASLINEGLQEPVPISAQANRASVGQSDTTPTEKKRSWWLPWS